MPTALATGARRRALIAATTLIGLGGMTWASQALSLIHISEPTRPY